MLLIMDNFISVTMNQSIIIANAYKWHLPYYFPKTSTLCPSAQTFIYTNPYIKIIKTPDDVNINFKRLDRSKMEEQMNKIMTRRISSTIVELVDKENIPPPPPLFMLRRTQSRMRIPPFHTW